MVVVRPIVPMMQITKLGFRRLRPKRCLLGENRKLRDIVASKLILDWSPEQISGWLKNQYPNDESLRVSHETIYRSLFIQARGALKKELMDHLRSKRRMRRSRHSSEHGQSRGQIVDAISIRQRPAEVEDRAIPGHWEGDLLAGGKNSYIATLVERHSRFVMLIKVPSKETEAVVAALSQHVRKLPASLKRSLTWDRGLEMAKQKEFTVATNVQVYFCDPQSPWQRGTNENTNLLLRQYFPRGTDLSGYSQAQLDLVSLRLNQRPRKTLGFETPADKLRAIVASTGLSWQRLSDKCTAIPRSGLGYGFGVIPWRGYDLWHSRSCLQQRRRRGPRILP